MEKIGKERCEAEFAQTVKETGVLDGCIDVRSRP
jgi:hypothetical protein